MLDQFLIAPLTEGLQTNVEPWLIPEKAFVQLNNAYVWRGRLRKRFGSTLILPASGATAGYEQLGSRLRIELGNTDGAGDISGTAPGAIFKIGQMFSIGTDLFTVVQTGTPGTMITNGAATTLTYNTTSGAYDIQGSTIATACFFYPAEPVMGFSNYENTAINDEPTFAFDTQFAYTYSGAAWARLGTGVWTGTNSQFFWTENYRGATSDATLLFVTNNDSTDNIRYWDGAAWNTFAPAYTSTATDTIEGCRVILSFKNRLIFFNTYESIGGAATINYPNRIRYSQDGSPVQADAWYEGTSTPGKGGYEDAATKEAIISARLLRDRVIVFFERSTWELVYTGNKIRPFVFQRINSELGAESTFSTVLFDKVLLGVGNVGIQACNGANVERIDDKIPNKVFEVHNGNEGIERVAGIRDYPSEMVYWTFPDAGAVEPIYPTKVLTYNYRNKTWSLNDDSITSFGYIQNTGDLTWAALTMTWAEWTDPWQSATYQSEYRKIVAGNQEGFTFLIEPDLPKNSSSIQITNLVDGGAGDITVTAVDHNMKLNDFINIENVQGATGIDGIYKIVSITSASEFVVNEPGFGAAYTGGGTIARVSKIDIKTKQYNFYQKSGKNLFVPKVAFYVDRTSSGQISVDFFPSASDRSLVNDGSDSGSLLGTSILETSPYVSVNIEQFQDRFWHVLYPQAEGETIQMRFYLNDTQMLDEDISLSDFQLNAMSIYARQVHRY